MAKRWNYCGDVSICHGGLYWQDSGDSDYVNAVKVTPCSDAGGPDNLFWIEKGTIYMPADKADYVLSIVGETKETAKPLDYVLAFDAYHGIESDLYGTHLVVQIGKTQDEPGRGWGAEREPDYILRGNASLRKFVRREFLRG